MRRVLNMKTVMAALLAVSLWLPAFDAAAKLGADVKNGADVEEQALKPVVDDGSAILFPSRSVAYCRRWQMAGAISQRQG